MTEHGTPDVSVIVPTRDYGSYLADAVESVRRQTVDSVEIVVVDDGSTDDTPEVLRRLAGPDLITRRIPPSGASTARNVALELASGRHVAFLDADDRWLPENLERKIELLEAEPEVGFVFSDCRRFGPEGNYYGRSQFELIPELEGVPTRPARRGNGEVIVGDTFAPLVALPLSPCYTSTLVIRAEAAKGLSFPEDVGVSQDTYYFLSLYRRARGAYLREPLVELRRHGGNASGADLTTVGGTIDAHRKFRDRVPLSRTQDRLVRRELSILWARVGWTHFWAGRTAQAAAAYGRALLHPGRRLSAAIHLLGLPLVPLLRRWSSPRTDREQDGDYEIRRARPCC